MERFFFSLGALLAGLAIMAGAYGAHGGKTALAQDQACSQEIYPANLNS